MNPDHAIPRWHHTPVIYMGLDAIVYVDLNVRGDYHAIGFSGDNLQPDFDERFGTRERFEAFTAEWVAGLRAVQTPDCDRCAARDELRTVIVGRPERPGYPAPHAELVCAECEDALRADGQLVPRGSEYHRLAWGAAVVAEIRLTSGHHTDAPTSESLDRYYNTVYEPKTAAAGWIAASHPASRLSAPL